MRELKLDFGQLVHQAVTGYRVLSVSADPEECSCISENHDALLSVEKVGLEMIKGQHHGIGLFEVNAFQRVTMRKQL